MLSPAFYNTDSLRKLGFAQAAFVGLAVVTCLYLAGTTFAAMREVWSARSMVRKCKAEAATLSRQSASEGRVEARHAQPGDGGVDAFAVRFSGWAAARSVQVESFIPEGAPAAIAVSVGGSDLGTWTASRVRVKGRGGFRQLMSLLDEFRDPGFPVKLESFSLQASRTASHSLVGYDLVLTVYEKKGKAG